MLSTHLRKISVFAVTAGVALAAAGVALAEGHSDGEGEFKATLNGYAEVPAVLTTGSGQATVTPSSDGKSLAVTLNFTKLAGVAQSAGLYLGLPGTTGGLIAPICGGTKPTCPTAAQANVTTTITAADVLAIAAQGLAAADLAAVNEALSNGAVYVNVLTDKFPKGEIRGQSGRGFSVGQGIGGGRGH